MHSCQGQVIYISVNLRFIIIELIVSRLDCIEKMHQHEADFGAFEPEEMYIASHIPDDQMNVFQEVRTKEEPDGEFLFT